MKLKHDKPLSNVAFNCKLRHYSMGTLAEYAVSSRPGLNLRGACNVKPVMAGPEALGEALSSLLEVTTLFQF